MNKNTAAAEVEMSLKKFTESLNTSDTKAIYDAYSTEGQYIPPTISGVWPPEVVAERADLFFRSKTMVISFDIKSITIENVFAFVNAISKSEIISKFSGVRKTFESKDFFVLRDEVGGWKIFRYMFETRIPKTE